MFWSLDICYGGYIFCFYLDILEREAITWEVEERHLHDRFQLHKRLLKDFYFLRRHQMLTRHEKVYIINRSPASF